MDWFLYDNDHRHERVNWFLQVKTSHCYVTRAQCFDSKESL